MSGNQVENIPKLEEWKKKTDAGKFAPRGDKLQVIDGLLKEFETVTSEPARNQTLKKLHNALDAYKVSHVGWERQARNKKGAIKALDDTLALYCSERLPSIPNPRANDAAYGRSGFMEAEHMHSRLGIIWLFANTKIKDEDDPVEEVKEPEHKTEESRAWYQRMWDAMVKFFQKVCASIKKEYEKATPGGLKATLMRRGAEFRDDFFDYDLNNSSQPKYISMVIKKLLNVILGAVGGSIMQVGQGLVNAVDAGYTRYQAWEAEKGTDISAGTPAAMVEAIKNAMNRSIAAGLLTAVQGGISAVPGFGSLAGTIASVMEQIYKFAMKAWQKSRIKSFIADAKQLWTDREKPDPFHARAQDFNTWYTSYITGVPAIAMVALNSGICGSKMVWLNMFNTNGVETTAGQFDKGVKFLDEHLMPYSVKYLSAFPIKFDSDSKIAKTYIDNASKTVVITQSSSIMRTLKNLLGNDQEKIVQRVIECKYVPLREHA